MNKTQSTDIRHKIACNIVEIIVNKTAHTLPEGQPNGHLMHNEINVYTSDVENPLHYFDIEYDKISIHGNSTDITSINFSNLEKLDEFNLKVWLELVENRAKANIINYNGKEVILEKLTKEQKDIFTEIFKNKFEELESDLAF